jgi:hypothetical protein
MSQALKFDCEAFTEGILGERSFLVQQLRLFKRLSKGMLYEWNLRDPAAPFIESLRESFRDCRCNDGVHRELVCYTVVACGRR